MAAVRTAYCTCVVRFNKKKIRTNQVLRYIVVLLELQLLISIVKR